MHPHLLALLYLVHLVRACTTTTNATTDPCPCDTPSTPCNTRSAWSILVSSGLTLLLCMWNAIHPALPLPHYRRIHIYLYHTSLVLVAFTVPAILLASACGEWVEARRLTKEARHRGHAWWTMYHSHFVLNGGFACSNGETIREIDARTFFLHLEAGDVVNPLFTKEDIKDKSSSDTLGKLILIVQLTWFVTQIVVRPVHGLAVTLVEMDTFFVALSALPLVFFWWRKPRCPRRPHVFYTRNRARSNEALAGDNLIDPAIGTSRAWTELLVPVPNRAFVVALMLAWCVFGMLHAHAWHAAFPTALERALWRVSTLALAGAPVMFFSVDSGRFLTWSCLLCAGVGMAARGTLVVLMLVGLRALPPDAYPVVSWMCYMPHL